MKKKKRTIWFILGIVILANVIVWEIAIYRNLAPKKEAVSSPYRSMAIPRLPLPDFSANPLSLGARLNVLIFFTFEDCPTCLFEAEFWGDTSRLFKEEEVRFFGITTEIDDKDIEMFCREYGMAFPIIKDPTGLIKSKILSIKEIAKLKLITPFKIFVGNNEIVHVEGAKKETGEQQQFPARVLELFYRL
jgi:peroxiredoxin